MNVRRKHELNGRSRAPAGERARMFVGDMLSRLSPFFRWLATPLGTLGWSAVAAALCGMFLHPHGFVVFFGLLAVTVLGVAWPWLSVRGLSGSMSFDRHRCREGEAVTVRVTVRNRMPWGVWGIAIDGGFEQPGRESAGDEPRPGLAFLPGRRTITVSLPFVPGCRGECPLYPPRLACGFPFGLWESSQPLSVAAPLLVWPRTFAVAALPAAADGQAADGHATRDRAGDWGDSLGVRPYRRGDPLRRVHWGLSARHGELIVRELQSHAVQRVQIVLDGRAAALGSPGPDCSREWAIRVAASLAEGWIGQGADVDLVLEHAAIHPRGGSARTRARAVLDAIARFRPVGDRELARLLDELGARSRGGLRIVVTTDLGLVAPGGAIRQRAQDRFIVLQSAGFEPADHTSLSAPLPIGPWILIDGPERAAAALRRLRKEVALEH